MRIRPGFDTFNNREPDLRPGHYYVSVIDSQRVVLAAGPFVHHLDALAHIKAVKYYCLDNYPDAAFWGFGTCRTPDGERIGKLNHILID